MKFSRKTIFDNLCLVFSKPLYSFLFVLFSLLFYLFFRSQTYSPSIKVNLGIEYYTILWIVQYTLIVLLSLFLVLTIFKYFYFSTVNFREQGAAGFASFIGILAAGCPGCTITIASYVGLTGFMSLFPFYGIELKVISIILLFGSIIYMLQTLQECKIKKHKKKIKTIEND